MDDIRQYAPAVIFIVACIAGALTVGTLILLWLVWLTIHIGNWMGIPVH